MPVSEMNQNDCEKGKDVQNTQSLGKIEQKPENFSGIAKLLYPNGQLKYEGQLSNGKFHGTGVSYYSNGKISYQGEYDSGKPNGKGVAYYSNSSKEFEGVWSEGKPCGAGV